MYLKSIPLAICLSLAIKVLAIPLPAAQETGSCSNEGEYNCISDTLWQRCASGQWSVAMSMAAGTSCYATFGISNTSPTPTVIPSASPSASPSLTNTTATPPITTPALSASASASASASPSTAAPAAISCPTTPPSLAAEQSYSGPASNFPDASQWSSFETIWCLNLPALQINDDADDIASIQSSVQSVAAQTNGTIDTRVILAIIMQESSGNLHVQTTTSPGAAVSNPGLMQSHNGVSYSASDPAGSILQMIKDGTLGTLGQPGGGDGLVQTAQQFGGLWPGIRAYNSGSVDASNLSDGLGATDSYCSDVANRLMGAKSG